MQLEKVFLRILVILAFITPIFLVTYYIFFGTVIMALTFSGVALIILIFATKNRPLENRYLLVLLFVISILLSINAHYSPNWAAYTYRFFFMRNLDIDATLADTFIHTEYFVNGDGTEWGAYIESTYQLDGSYDQTLADLNSKLTRENNWYGPEDRKLCPYRERFSGAGGFADHKILVEENQLIIKLFYQPLVYGPLVKQSCFAHS